ncbi:G-type lectin S-receptor-like serine/threonine-protein kinase CES101 isoform X2 [Medicago truncatula]|uniref:Receptor-like serine/threonine-protein kinase n=1 Tax=Medicago truncatula TaxID=3880 RepID=G7L990_MEDTR|nr:G-type lectin S-receptor-like serine/threonine-protein kinase CES101 isoform X2 [Medicago truncatula]AET02749.1 Serine/Threonine kinase family protein [Medicago truncatula]
MISFEIKKQVVLIYLWLWWNTTATNICVKATSDSLKPGDTLNSKSKLCSKQGKFCLYFNRTLDSEDAHLVIGINADYGAVVWMYDRNHSIDLNSAVLSLDYSGVLKIQSQNRKPIIICSSPQPINTLATILDTGNFVLRQIYPNGTKSILWQSFDYPITTLIPTMKLGVNRKTGHNWSLVSWLAPSLPNSGGFSVEWEPMEGELNIKQRGKVYWKSGKLNSNGLFKNILVKVQHVYQYIIVSNKDEDSFTFEIKDQNYKMFPGWELFSTGMLTSSEGEIANADMCYGYNTDGGCQKWEDIPTCREPGEVFKKMTGRPNTDSATIQDNVTYGYSDCKISCWRNCECNGFQEFYRNGTGCIFYSSNSTQDVDLEYSNIYNVMVKPTLNHHGKSMRIWIGVAIAAAILLLCPLLLFVAKKKQKYARKDIKSKREENEMQDLASSHESFGVKDLEDDFKGHDIKVFNYSSILEATMNFSPENKLGQGGYGPVYKGILPTGQEIAVKRLSKTSGQGIVEFKNEFVLICELQHTNLVQLLGCCIHQEERILIYEYMPNKSLDFYLFDSTRRKCLDWKKRLNIIEGISQGLLYLHKYSRLKIIHRDLKASNILLDENMNPKISDFGMARMFTQQESVVNTNRIVGTYGYMSPEYAMEGICSTKSDVYSFGVLLLEIICGRRNNSFYDVDRPLNLIGHAWELWNDGEYLQLMDPTLNDTFVPDEVQKCIHVGLLCVEQYANNRPTMSDVISMLTNKYAPTTLPRRPAFYVTREIFEGETTSKGLDTDTYSMTAISTSCEVEGKI